jgi:L-lysine 6-oxidase
MTIGIHPSVGIARLGNSPEGDFCLSPTTIGGLPYEADKNGIPTGPIKNFKDKAGRIRRQGQVFKLFDGDNPGKSEVTLNSPNIKSIEWTAHLANKKAAWYQYSELQGNLLYGQNNSYTSQGIDLRNPNVAGNARKNLIIDPGPRTISGRNKSIEINKASAPSDYRHVSFPVYKVDDKPQHGTAVKSLGTLKTDKLGRLIVLGGYGHAGGDEPLTSYGGSNTWHDDISDGPVYCTINYKDKTPSKILKAWVVVGSPDYAPEIVNISTLNDTFFDVGVRCKKLVPTMYSKGKYLKSYRANFQRDILPIIERISGYQWVANVQSMSGFFAYHFDYADNSVANKPKRMQYYQFFRQLDPKKLNPTQKSLPQEQLFSHANGGQLPMMPMNSASNSVSNEIIEKFLALDETQLFLLSQWAEGRFDNNPDYTPHPVTPLDAASVGNCVGLPMCPGIEVTWSLQNEKVYEDAYIIAHQKGKDGYNKNGLAPSRDECEGGGCQPGDLTKRMACPWQADFFQCTIQYVNFTEPKINKATKITNTVSGEEEKWKLKKKSLGETINVTVTHAKETSQPLTPSYYSYWWPPQAPWDTLTGEITQKGQSQNHLPAGQQMNYARGINSFVQMVEHWSALAFIRNNNSSNPGFPYFTETERNNEIFQYQEVGIGQITGNIDDSETTIPVFFIDADQINMKQKGHKGKMMAEYFEERAFKSIRVAEGGLGLPRSGTKMRR